eukprot:m.412975 g.412975  ORF g.412975 m.412975 type:complete len:191 (+) comp20172_c4_seq12:2492-3064(+)
MTSTIFHPVNPPAVVGVPPPKGDRAQDGPSDTKLAAGDAKRLYEAGEKRFFGTDEATFIDVFSKRSFSQLRATFDEYSKICERDIRESIGRETGFHLKQALQALVDIARSPAGYFASRLFKSMDGFGTHNRSVIFIMVDQSESHLPAIEANYSRMFGVELNEHLRARAGGNYKKMLLALLGHGPEEDSMV